MIMIYSISKCWIKEQVETDHVSMGSFLDFVTFFHDVTLIINRVGIQVGDLLKKIYLFDFFLPTISISLQKILLHITTTSTYSPVIFKWIKQTRHVIFITLENKKKIVVQEEEKNILFSFHEGIFSPSDDAIVIESCLESRQTLYNNLDG